MQSGKIPLEKKVAYVSKRHDNVGAMKQHMQHMPPIPVVELFFQELIIEDSTDETSEADIILLNTTGQNPSVLAK